MLRLRIYWLNQAEIKKKRGGAKFQTEWKKKTDKSAFPPVALW